MTSSWIWEGNLLQPGDRRGRARVRICHGWIDQIHWLAEETAPAGRGPGAGDRGSSGPPVWRAPDSLWLLPGFIDGHTHLIGSGLRALSPDLSQAGSKTELLEMMASWLQLHPGDGPVAGIDWDQSLWADPSWPTRAELDSLAPARPVWLRRVCGHVAVLNSAALAGVGLEWPDLDPESGLAREALPMALPRLFPPSSEEMDAALLRAQSEAWRCGVTGIQEMGAWNGFGTFARAQAAGLLHLRVSHFFPRDALARLKESGLAPGFGGDRLRVGGIKLFLDGSLGGRSAALRRPYPSGGEEERGLLLFRDDELRAILFQAAEAGYQTAMHAIGDRACDQAVSAVETLRREGVEFPLPGPRLEHAEMLDDDLIQRAAGAGFLFSMQPNFTARWQNPGQLYERTLGRERALALNRYRSAGAAGRLLFGSDTMPLGPMWGLRGAVNHPAAAERLPFEQALLAYTSGSGQGVTHPFTGGRAVEGAAADLVVLQVPEGAASCWKALLRGERTDWPDAVQPVATFVDGVLRYADASLRLPGEVPAALT